jgi:hypothetical protein
LSVFFQENSAPHLCLPEEESDVTLALLALNDITTFLPAKLLTARLGSKVKAELDKVPDAPVDVSKEIVLAFVIKFKPVWL